MCFYCCAHLKAFLTSQFSKLYIVTANNENTKFVNGLQLDPNNSDTFLTDTKVCLSTIQGNGGSPLSCVLHNDTLLLFLYPAMASRDDKIFWNTTFTGSTFDQDQVRVWSYFAQCYIDTTG